MTMTRMRKPLKKMKTATTRICRAGFAAIVTAAFLLVWLPGRQVADAAAGPIPQKELKPYALIFGTVWDKDDRPVYGVPVKIRPASEKKEKAKWELVSNHTGEFAQRVPVGPSDYIVWADIKTPKGTPKPQKIVHIQTDERVDISLHLNQ